MRDAELVTSGLMFPEGPLAVGMGAFCSSRCDGGPSQEPIGLRNLRS